MNTLWDTYSGLDFDADGTNDAEYFYTYDSNGNLILSESDYDADGIIDNTRNITFNSSGLPTYYETITPCEAKFQITSIVKIIKIAYNLWLWRREIIYLCYSLYGFKPCIEKKLA